MNQRELERLIAQHRENYYSDSPTISDSEFDALVDQLRKIAPNSSTLTKVGAPTSSRCFAKVKHDYVIGSLEKVNSMDAFKKWWYDRKIKSATAMLKYDGMSIVCKYDSGKLVSAVTRGDSEVGEDITENVRKMQNTVPNTDFTGTVRGEITILRSIFNKHFKDQNANPRNLAGGTAKRKDGSGCEFLNVTFYKWFEYTGTCFGMMTEINRIFPSNNAWCKLIDNPAQLETYLQEFADGKRDALDFDIDGMVISSNDVLYENKKHPDYSIAYKFEHASAISKILDIEWHNSGSRINPIACIEPTELMGVTIRRASIHNLDFIREKGISIGALVTIERRNDVIPYIANVIEPGPKPFTLPEACPTCSQKSIEVQDQYVTCNNPNCESKGMRQIQKLISVLEIDHVGTKTIELISKGFSIEEFVQIINNDEKLQKFEEWISQQERMGIKSAKKICDEIQAKREISVVQFFMILDINNFGSSRVEMLVEAGYDTVDKILELCTEQIVAIKGLGSGVAAEFFEGLLTRASLIFTMKEHFKIKETKTSTKGVTMSKPAQQYTFLITGTLSKPRKEIEEMIISAGHCVGSGVNSRLNFLVQADPSSQSSKSRKAHELGIQTIGEEQLMEILGL